MGRSGRGTGDESGPGDVGRGWGWGIGIGGTDGRAMEELSVLELFPDVGLGGGTMGLIVWELAWEMKSIATAASAMRILCAIGK